MRYVVLILMLAGSCLAGEKFMRKATHEEVHGINLLKQGQCIQGLKYGYCVGGTNDPSRTMVLRGDEWFEIVPDVIVTSADQVKQLAKDGEICKVYGHTWEPEVVNFGTATFGNMARKRKGLPYFFCRICKARQVTKTVTEIIPAKEQK